jgi:hypothetical protein
MTRSRGRPASPQATTQSPDGPLACMWLRPTTMTGAARARTGIVR